MASNNTLLSPGGSFKKEEKLEVKKEEVKEVKEELVHEYAPCWMYHASCPQGTIVKTDDEYNELHKKGWSKLPVK